MLLDMGLVPMSHGQLPLVVTGASCYRVPPYTCHYCFIKIITEEHAAGCGRTRMGEHARPCGLTDLRCEDKAQGAKNHTA